MDFDNDYKTLDLSYMESVAWAFKTLYDKGLVYEGFRVLAYCWRCETPLSNTETRMDDVYKDRTDPASTVEFRTGLRRADPGVDDDAVDAGTQRALVVGPDIDYAVLERDGQRYILAESRLGAYQKEFADATQVATLKGSELVGRRYTPLFDFLVETHGRRTRGFTVLSGDFVSTEDGTGVVQVAPSHGAADPAARGQPDDDRQRRGEEPAGLPGIGAGPLRRDRRGRYRQHRPDQGDRPGVWGAGVRLRLDRRLRRGTERGAGAGHRRLRLLARRRRRGRAAGAGEAAGRCWTACEAGDAGAPMSCAAPCDPGADGGGGETVVDHIRLFPLREDVRWTYRVHEQILPALRRAGIPVRWTESSSGTPAIPTRSLRARKLDRDARILDGGAERPAR